MPHQNSALSKTVTDESASGRTESRPSERLAIVDVVRGFVMILMALDHTREFFSDFTGDPLDPQRTTPLLFMTRWITHLCAPAFVFLAGTSIFLQQKRKPNPELTRFLLVRGLWLIGAEFTLVHLVFNYNWEWNVQVLEVIWAIGASMMIIALFIRFGVRWMCALGLLLICTHNAFDNVLPASFGRAWWLWQLLHVPGILAQAGKIKPPLVVVAYPVLPWVGVMALGFAFGNVLRKPVQKQRAFLLWTGTLALAGFVLLRWMNIYGDPAPWRGYQVWWRTLASFLNVRKYPPSLLFLLVTLGAMALITFGFASLEAQNRFGRLRGWLTVFGRVPFFYFLLHIAVIHFFALVLCASTGGNWRWWTTEFPNGGVLAGRPPAFGYGLGMIWSIWLVVDIACYFACRWYGGVKARSRKAWTSYL